MCCKMKMDRHCLSTLFPPGWIIRALGPEHSYLKDTGRAEYVSVTDDEAVNIQECARLEGNPALRHPCHSMHHEFAPRSKDKFTSLFVCRVVVIRTFEVAKSSI